MILILFNSSFNSYKELIETNIFPYENFKDCLICFKTIENKNLYSLTEWIQYLNKTRIFKISIFKDKEKSKINENLFLLVKNDYGTYIWQIISIDKDRYFLYEKKSNTNTFKNTKNFEEVEKLVIMKVYSYFEQDFPSEAFNDRNKEYSVKIKNLNNLLASMENLYVLMDSESVNFSNGKRYAKPYVEQDGDTISLIVTPLSLITKYNYYEGTSANFNSQNVLSRVTREEFYNIIKKIPSQIRLIIEVILEDGIVYCERNEVLECCEKREKCEKSFQNVEKIKEANKKDFFGNLSYKLKKNRLVVGLCSIAVLILCIYFMTRKPFVQKEELITYSESRYNTINHYRKLSKKITIDKNSAVKIGKSSYIPEVIAKEAFCNSKIKQLTINANIIHINQQAFENCDRLTSIKLNNGLREIGSYAFRNCTGIDTIEIPPTVYEIGDSIFEGVKLKNLTIGKQLYELYGERLADSIDENTQITFTDDSAAFDPLTYCVLYEDYEGDLCICDISSPFDVFVIPDGVKKLKRDILNEYCVKHDGYLNNFNRAYLGSYSKIKEIIISDSVIEIEDNFFENSQIKKIKIPDAVTDIGYMLFNGSELEEISFGPDVVEIGYGAFENTNLKEIELPPKLTEIGSHSFEKTQLTHIEFPEKLNKIGYNAFQYCNLEEVVIPDSVEKIGSSAFADNPIKKLILGNSIEELDLDVFSNCQIEEIIIPDSVTSISYRAFKSNPLKKVIIGNGVRTIYTDAFSYTQLEVISIPKNVKNIYESAFSNTPLKKIALSGGKDFLSGNAFINTKVEEIILNMPIKFDTISYYFFDQFPEDVIIYVDENEAQKLKQYTTAEIVECDIDEKIKDFEQKYLGE